MFSLIILCSHFWILSLCRLSNAYHYVGNSYDTTTDIVFQERTVLKTIVSLSFSYYLVVYSIKSQKEIVVNFKTTASHAQTMQQCKTLLLLQRFPWFLGLILKFKFFNPVKCIVTVNPSFLFHFTINLRNDTFNWKDSKFYFLNKNIDYSNLLLSQYQHVLNLLWCHQPCSMMLQGSNNHLTSDLNCWGWTNP